MPEYLTPGVYVEETAYRSHAIERVTTTTTAFAGPTLAGPLATDDDALPLLTSLADFESHYGGPGDVTIDEVATPNYLALAVRAFFNEGGRRLYVARTPDNPTIEHYAQALDRFSAMEDIALVAAPGAAARPGLAEAVGDALIAHAEAPNAYRFAILDSPPNLTPREVRDVRARWNSPHGGFFYPWLVIADPLATAENGRAQHLAVPPSGTVCGLYARNDVERAVWKAPANIAARTVIGLEYDVSKAEQEVLNPLGIDVVRRVEGRGIRLWGARTVSSDPEAKYVSVSRYRTFLAASLDRGLQWAAFEPNGEKLWANLRQAVEDFLHVQWREGALQGSTPQDAYFVRCDSTTMTQNDLDQGRVVCVFGIAALRPAEFLISKISQLTADAEA